MLHALVESVCASWPVDRQRLLLTGLSDGATFTLLAGLAPDSPFSHLAPVSGVLHPANFANGNLGARARTPRVAVPRRPRLALPGGARAGRARRAGARRCGDRVPRDRRPLARLSARGERRPSCAGSAWAERAWTARRALLSGLRSAVRAPPQAALAAIRSGDRLPDRRASRRTDSRIRLTIAEMSNPSSHPMRSALRE